MFESVLEIAKSDDSKFFTPDETTLVSINRLIFVMKGIAEDDLWDEAERHLKQNGFHDLRMSEAPIRMLQGMIRARVASGAGVSRRSARFMSSATCGGGSSPGGGGPAHFPSGGGDGGTDGGTDGGVQSQ